MRKVLTIKFAENSNQSITRTTRFSSGVRAWNNLCDLRRPRLENIAGTWTLAAGSERRWQNDYYDYKLTSSVGRVATE